MDVTPSPAAADHLARLRDFMDECVFPAEPVYARYRELRRGVDDHSVPPVVEGLPGGAGASDDTPLAEMRAGVRTLRIADGPDAVHLRTVARQELRKHRHEDGAVHVPQQQAAGSRVQERA